MQQEIWGPDGTADLLLLTGAGLLIRDAWLMPDPLAMVDMSDHSSWSGHTTDGNNVISYCFCWQQMHFLIGFGHASTETVIDC